MKLLSKLKSVFSEAVAPVEIKCMCCGRDVFSELGFCPECIEKVKFNTGKLCARCGVMMDGEADYCGNCSFDKIYFDKAHSVFCYDGAVKFVILEMKFNNCGAYSRVLARYLASFAQVNKLDFDIVCYAPMSKKSLKERRYNQSQLLAEHFCDILSRRDCLVHALTKVKETERQERLGRTERKSNLVGSYRLAVGADVKGKRVLVIDDVKTTGSTLNECAKVLKRGGAASVEGLTVAASIERFHFEQEA